MISAFLIGPAASGLCDIDTVLFIGTQSQKNGKSWQGEIRPIISQMENPKLSAYFRPVRTSQFFHT